MRRAFDHPRLARTMSNDEASRTRVGYRLLAAELGLPLYRAWSGRGRGVGCDLRE
jgi:hypothetical protein